MKSLFHKLQSGSYDCEKKLILLRKLSNRCYAKNVSRIRVNIKIVLLYHSREYLRSRRRKSRSM